MSEMCQTGFVENNVALLCLNLSPRYLTVILISFYSLKSKNCDVSRPLLHRCQFDRILWNDGSCRLLQYSVCDCDVQDTPFITPKASQ